MAKYIKQEMPNMNGTNEPQVYYRLQTNRNIKFKEFTEHICQPGTGVNRGTVEQVMAHVADRLAELLGDGYSVTIDGVGTFKATLGLKRDKEMDSFNESEAKLNARSLQLNGVSYRADKSLVKKANLRCKLERAGESRLRQSPYTKEERLGLALDFLAKHGAMRIANYVEITGLSRSAATKELIEFRNDSSSGISFIGRGSSKVYVKQMSQE
ncbi:MAG: DNA-binding protein [Bacteroidaceae bacterium]|nr:DNA-binding protein [Bacteroidaceae bacterium]